MRTDFNTGSVIPYNYWTEKARVFCVDVSDLKSLKIIKVEISSDVLELQVVSMVNW